MRANCPGKPGAFRKIGGLPHPFSMDIPEKKNNHLEVPPDFRKATNHQFQESDDDAMIGLASGETSHARPEIRYPPGVYMG